MSYYVMFLFTRGWRPTPKILSRGHLSRGITCSSMGSTVRVETVPFVWTNI